MKKHILTLIILLTVFLPTQNVSAFDGNRKGFVLSGGVGVGVTTFTSNKRDNPAYTLGSTIGYGINNKNILVIDRGMNHFIKNGTVIFEKYVGVSWFHFFKQQKKSFFTKVGLAYYPNGLYIGGGYMFSNNVQLGVTYMHFTEEWASDHLQLLVSYVAF